jgi:isoquinoline 1-oxidoreductase alpha subunit
MTAFTLNGKPVTAKSEADTPLLWVIRDELKLTGTKYGCGIAQCGACTVHVDGKAVPACVTPLGSVKGAQVMTIEGLSPDSSHPLQKAWVAEEVPQCGYCQSGQIMKAAELLKSKPKPTRAEIVSHMNRSSSSGLARKTSATACSGRRLSSACRRRSTRRER